MYKANHYVSIDGAMYVKGEAIPDGLPEEKIAWLLKAGAICEDTAAGELAKEPEVEPETEPEAIEIIEEAPEVDVMDGIVADKPTKKPTRRRKSD